MILCYLDGLFSFMTYNVLYLWLTVWATEARDITNSASILVKTYYFDLDFTHL